MLENRKYFYSKNNTVFLENNIVYKEFSSIEKFNNEKEMNRFLSKNNIRVPKIVGDKNLTLQYEFIDGSTYADLSDNLTEIRVISLVEWIFKYNTIVKTPHCDINLRNFIYNEKYGCVGIDFEKKTNLHHETTFENELGRICAFISTYDPLFTSAKKNAIASLITYAKTKKDNFDIEKLLISYEVEIEILSQRRKEKSLSVIEAKDFISTIINIKSF